VVIALFIEPNCIVPSCEYIGVRVMARDENQEVGGDGCLNGWFLEP
jgi:hypothetical protein